MHADTQFIWDDANPEFRVATKLRSIDPDVWLNGHVQPLSALDPGFAALRHDYLTTNQGKWPMRVVSPNS